MINHIGSIAVSVFLIGLPIGFFSLVFDWSIDDAILWYLLGWVISHEAQDVRRWMDNEERNR